MGRGWDRVRVGCLVLVTLWTPVWWPTRSGAAEPAPVTAELVSRLSERMRGRHPELLGLERMVSAERANADGTRRWADPEGMIGGGLYRFPEMSRENGDILVGIEQRLPLLGKETAARALAASNAVAAGVGLEVRFSEMRRDLARTLFAAALARMEAALVAEDLQWLGTQVEVASTRLAAGREMGAAVLRLENARDRRRLEWTNAVARLRDAERAVERAVGEVGVVPEGGFALPPVGIDVRYGPTLVRFAEQSEPEVRRREQEVRVASAMRRVTERSRRPDVALGVQSYHEARTGSAAQGMATLTVSLPWFNGRNYRRDLERDDARLRAAEARVLDAREGVRREVHGLVTRLRASRQEALLLHEVIVPRTERMLEVMQARWAAGGLDLRELLEVRREWIESELASARATEAYWVAVSELLLCCGLEDLGMVEGMMEREPVEQGRKP